MEANNRDRSGRIQVDADTITRSRMIQVEADNRDKEQNDSGGC